jgi:hypothetical protein
MWHDADRGTVGRMAVLSDSLPKNSPHTALSTSRHIGRTF